MRPVCLEKRGYLRSQISCHPAGSKKGLHCIAQKRPSQPSKWREIDRHHTYIAWPYSVRALGLLLLLLDVKKGPFTTRRLPHQHEMNLIRMVFSS